MATELERMVRFFGPEAELYGLVDVGGDLSSERLLHAYRHGVFPWYDDPLPVCWWSPDPRAIFEMDGLHISRRLARTMRTGRFQVSINRDFAGVMEGCADRPGEGTWITPAMLAAYQELHRLGHAHSVETWLDGELAGGVYGVAIGGLFAAESMFHRASDASKVALVHLFEHLRQRGFTLFDTQILTPHTASLGAVEIPRREYLRRLRSAVEIPVRFEAFPPPLTKGE
jgi:leucyl/phenylalanyl-tRNA--protein transferase